MMWIAERRVTAPRTDEDAAMCYKKAGPFPTRNEARNAMIIMMIEEGSPRGTAAVYFAEIRRLYEEPDDNQATLSFGGANGDLVFQIREI